MPTPSTDRLPSRPWRGVSADDRVADRRERLLQAGLEVFGTVGYAGGTVADVCATAGLTRRYFYAAFANREALLLAVAERIVDDAFAALAPELRDLDRGVEAVARDAFGAFVAALVDDPRRARVLLVETVGVGPEFEERRRELLRRLSDLFRDAGRAILGDAAPPPLDTELTARALMGAAIELLVAHVRGEIVVERAQLVAHLSRIFDRAAPVTSTPEAP
ncbi:TetR/AcrR family transcriptional regulator [Patulibacter sp. SYSU D01012]|uniref:TetR/AcrR family transcriptional regulator n=1 Tax=Patulibacter sp. SYSU D01012 TaxID=2817381 RepID=UPI001B30DF92